MSRDRVLAREYLVVSVKYQGRRNMLGLKKALVQVCLDVTYNKVL